MRILRRWEFFILLLILLHLSLWLTEAKAAHRIIVMTSTEYQQQTQQLGYRGVLAGLGITYEEGTNTYSMSKGYEVELMSYTQRNPLITFSQADDVIAIICQTASDCRPALETTAAKNLLIIATEATGNELNSSENLMRIPTASRVRNMALYQKMKQDQVKNFIVIHATQLTMLESYNEFMSSYYSDVQFEQQRPNWIASFPLTDKDVLTPSQQGMTEATLLQLIPQLNTDSIIFIGFSDSFRELTQAPSPLQAYAWYSSDTILPITAGFSNLQVISAYQHDKSEDFRYSTAFDAGTFLKKVMASYLITNGVAERQAFLTVAKEMVLSQSEAKTGLKTW